MSFRWFLYKIYPIALPLYLLPISLLYAHFNNSLFAIIIAIVGLFIPLVFAHPDPELLFKEILRSLGFRNMMNSLDYQNSDYKKAVEEILKEHNLNFDVKIINSESINAFSGFSTITITKGFVNAFPLNDKLDKLKIMPLLGHEITHKKRVRALIKEMTISLVAFLCLFVLTNIVYIILFGKTIDSVIQYYVFFLGIYLIIFYVFRRNELEADKGGFVLAKDGTGIREFLIKTDVREEKTYNLWDKYDELFRLHPNPINRIKKLEKMNVFNELKTI